MKKRILILLVAVAVINAVFPCKIAPNTALAEENVYFIICKPGSEINVRKQPKIKSQAIACKWFGEMVITDGVEKNGFVHVVNVFAEETDGWIYKGLLSDDPPTAVNLTCQVFNSGTVACRKYADGKVIRRIADGTEVIVYAVSEKWCVTDHGYIKTEFLTVNAKVREQEGHN